MNYKKSLKNISGYIWFGAFLVLIVAAFYSQKERISLVYHKDVSQPSSIGNGKISYAKVTKVIDGDTLIIDTGQKIRYIGIDTPEVETGECFATEAAEINEDMVMDREVKLEKDTSETDKYGRLLRYVYVDEGSDGWEMINNELINVGLAKVETVLPDTKYKDKFIDSENYARENKLGLWGKCF